MSCEIQGQEFDTEHHSSSVWMETYRAYDGDYNLIEGWVYAQTHLLHIHTYSIFLFFFLTSIGLGVAENLLPVSLNRQHAQWKLS